MKKNGFGVIDAISLVVVLGIISLAVILNVSNALKNNDNKEDLYQHVISNYLEIAQNYGETIKDQVKENTQTITVEELVEKGYIHSTYQDSNNKDNINKIKIDLKYDAENDKVYAELN